MAAERFAIGIADEGGAIDDFGGEFGGFAEELGFGEEGEPAAEGCDVSLVVEVGRGEEEKENDAPHCCSVTGRCRWDGAACRLILI